MYCMWVNNVNMLCLSSQWLKVVCCTGMIWSASHITGSPCTARAKRNVVWKNLILCMLTFCNLQRRDFSVLSKHSWRLPGTQTKVIDTYIGKLLCAPSVTKQGKCRGKGVSIVWFTSPLYDFQIGHIGMTRTHIGKRLCAYMMIKHTVENGVIV